MKLPSFNDFSVGILKGAYDVPKNEVPDLRKVLQTIKVQPNKAACVSVWKKELFKNVEKRSIVKALTSNGLVDPKNWKLTDAGTSVLSASNAEAALRAFAKQLLTNCNGQVVIDGVRSLVERGEAVTKETLQEELESFGVQELANATTDHTNHMNWLVEAKVLGEKPNYSPNDTLIKELLGLSTSERVGYYSLPLPQQIFLSVMRRLVEKETDHEISAKAVIDECLRDHKKLFNTSQLSKKVMKPLEDAGWLELKGRTKKVAGGKSGSLSATPLLLGIPISAFLPDYDAVIPADLRAKINTPRDKIQEMLKSSKTYDKGLGLELLALRMIVDLGLNPRAFRLRAKESAYAELDIVAEGAHLTFSRWNVQCKCTKNNVSLGDIAKEVGLAIYTKAHVVAVVTTSGFSREALNYCREVSQSTHLQFVLINGSIVDEYLGKGPQKLIEYVTQNSKNVMLLKRAQPIDAAKDD